MCVCVCVCVCVVLSVVFVLGCCGSYDNHFRKQRMESGVTGMFAAVINDLRGAEHEMMFYFLRDCQLKIKKNDIEVQSLNSRPNDCSESKSQLHFLLLTVISVLLLMMLLNYDDDDDDDDVLLLR